MSKLRENFLFSKSSILRYIQCPMSFYFNYITDYGKLFRMVSEVPEHLTRGTTLHEFYESYNNKIDLDDIEETLCHDEMYARNIMGFYTILENYKLTRALESESKYINETDKFMGFIDAVYDLSKDSVKIIMDEVNEERTRLIKKPKETLAIIDYKTGKYHPYLQRKYEYELNLYVKLIETTTDKKIGYIGMFFTNQPYSFIKPVVRKNVEKDWADFFKQKDNIANDIYDRKHSVLCGYCDFKGICDSYSDSIIDRDTETYY